MESLAVYIKTLPIGYVEARPLTQKLNFTLHDKGAYRIVRDRYTQAEESRLSFVELRRPLSRAKPVKHLSTCFDSSSPYSSLENHMK